MADPIKSWLADERIARACWSRVAEPTDWQAATLRAMLGPVEALAVAVGRSKPPAAWVACLSRGDDGLAVVMQRWQSRVAVCDPIRDQEAMAAAGGHLLVPGDSRWPERLGDLGATEPVCLWVRGTASLADLVERSAALVGSRASTSYGLRVAGDLAVGLAREKVTVLSGAAYGIDAAAHRAVIAAREPTVAVLACGADRSYPVAHSGLLDRISETGLVVSEMPPDAIPTRWRFLERNRIIAGLTRVTVVVEAAWRSGALNTARHALTINRNVGVVPGPITSPASAGCHRLLRENKATCITTAEDIVELVGPMGTAYTQEPLLPMRAYDGLNPLQLRVWEALPVTTWVRPDQVSKEAGLGEREVDVMLGSLERTGRAVAHASPAGRRLWQRASRELPMVQPT